MLSQLERQYATPSYQGKQPLDFTPFASALADLSPAREAELSALILEKTIPQLRQSLTDKAFTCEELTLFYIARIQRYDGHYNSVLELNPEALIIARQCDLELNQGALHGIPVLLKANIGTGDKLHTSAGAIALANAYADHDAFLVQALRRAGAVILGKTNLSEWANFMSYDSSSGFSVLGGQVRNAYGRFDVGGSSSGSGASASLNFASIAIGTETSGSLTSPASQNGLVTVKPSLGLVSRDRIIPITEKQDTAGPMTRTVMDSAILLSIIAQADSSDPDFAERPQSLDIDYPSHLSTTALQGKRVGIITRENPVREGEDLITTRLQTWLESAGATVVQVSATYPEWSLLTFFYGTHKGVNAYLQQTDAPFQTLGEIIAYNKEDLPNRAPFGQDLLEWCAKTPLNEETAQAYERIAHENRTNARECVEKLLREYQVDVLADFNNYGTLFYAPSGYPAVSVQAGLRENGEPISITFFASNFSEAQLLSYAYAFEHVAQGRAVPTIQG